MTSSPRHAEPPWPDRVSAVAVSSPLPQAEPPPMLGVDVGGTKIAVGMVSATGKLYHQQVQATPKTAAEIIATITEMCQQILDSPASVAPAAIGICAAGFINAERTTIRTSPNLPFHETRLAAEIEQRLQLPATLENDATAAIWGEHRFGAAKEKNHAVMVTLGTGVGGGIIHNGCLLIGAQGMAAEIGHMMLVPDGRTCGCGLTGCWETYASGTALLQLIHDNFGAEAGGPTLDAALRAGEARAQKIVDEYAQWVGMGLANLAAMLDPEIFILGGGVIRAGKPLLAPVTAAYNEYLSGSSRRPPTEIVLATCGNNAGMMGAAELARERLFKTAETRNNHD